MSKRGQKLVVEDRDSAAAIVTAEIAEREGIEAAIRAGEDVVQFLAALQRVAAALTTDATEALRQVTVGFDEMQYEAVEDMCGDALANIGKVRTVIASFTVPADFRRKAEKTLDYLEIEIKLVGMRNKERKQPG
jgi:hypothetical protein